MAMGDQESQAVWAGPGGFRVGIAEAERHSPLFGLLLLSSRLCSLLFSNWLPFSALQSVTHAGKGAWSMMSGSHYVN